MIPMRGVLLRRRNMCSVDRCGNKNTYLFHRGREVGRNPMHLCDECIRDILTEYIGIVGADTAWENLGGVVSGIIPAPDEKEQENEETTLTEETETEETEESEEAPQKTTRKKKGDNA